MAGFLIMAMLICGSDGEGRRSSRRIPLAALCQPPLQRFPHSGSVGDLAPLGFGLERLD
jgi:hypothetical protein